MFEYHFVYSNQSFSSKMMITLVLYIIFTTGQSHAENDKPPLCVLCECNPLTTDNSDYEIICLSKLDVDFYNISFWRNLTSNIPYKFSSLTINNNVFGELSKEFPAAQLIHLNLAKNAITSVLVGIFKNLNFLEVLIFSYNEIEMFKTDSSQNYNLTGISFPLPYVKEIRLDHNKIGSLNSELFKNTTSLQILDLSYNPIDIINEQTLLALSSLTKLKELYLQNTGIKTLPDNMLSNFKSLQILDISANPFELIPRSLAEVKALTNLYMNNTRIKKLTHENIFLKIPTLKILHMCHNEKLLHIGKFCFGGLKNIEDIKMSNNVELSIIKPLAFARKKNNRDGFTWLKIKKLYLQWNNISLLDKNVSGAWDGLEDLDIEGNPWMCECRNQWIIDDLYPRYLNINEVQAKSLRCSSPENMADISFQELYEKKIRLKCVVNPEDSSSTMVPTIIGFFSGFLVAITLIVFLILGYKRNWYHIFEGCRYRKLSQNSINSDSITTVHT